MPDNGQASSLWMLYAFGTVVCWGVYGILLHSGVVAMNDLQYGRYKAFFWVGVAYFLFAVLAPAGILLATGASWSMPVKGLTWSLVAGVAGAIGAFCVLVAFANKGHPAVVMSIIFAGAPIVNAAVALTVHPPAGGLASIKWQFIAGILLAAAGGTLVTLYKPPPGPAKPAVEKPK
ncbi:MAG: hypothetical protein CMJ83_17330 [Planctomycetes bacterium]|nr:hypothetical protein [Planctomycetota bacterium]